MVVVLTLAQFTMAGVDDGAGQATHAGSTGLAGVPLAPAAQYGR